MKNCYYKKGMQKGQVVIILLLLILVALSIGLAITQRSISNVSTSSQNEQSSRAFSAAEAGIQRALQLCTPGQNCSPPQVSLTNQSTAVISVSPPLPLTGQTLEYPPISKEEVAQFWLADPNTPAPALPSPFYKSNKFDLYFGNPNSVTDKPALEVTVISYCASAGGTLCPFANNYSSVSYYVDSDITTATRAVAGASGNGFTPVNCDNPTIQTVNLTDQQDSQFYCKVTIPCSGCPQFTSDYTTNYPVLVRIRPLYISGKHKIAIKPDPLVTNPGLPPQASIYTSQGNYAQSLKTVKVFRVIKVLPFFMDFSVFSAGSLTK